MRSIRPLPNTLRVFAPGLLLFAVLAAGCATQHSANDTDSAAPGSSAGALLGPDAGELALGPLGATSLTYMPLAVGNRWDYTIRFRTRLVSAGAPDVIEVTESPWTSEIVSRQVLGGHEYFMQAEYDPRAVVRPPSPQWALRQNRGGLYSQDLIAPGGARTAAPEFARALVARIESAVAEAAANSPHRAAYMAAAQRLAGRLGIMGMPGRGQGLPGLQGFAGLREDGGGLRHGDPLPGEISLLVYPLFRGAHWIVRDSPRFSRVVMSQEQTNVPAGGFNAWVLRGRSELYGASDRVYFWYARQGLIRITYHGESEVTDIEGNPLGLLSMDMDQSLSGLTLTESRN